MSFDLARLYELLPAVYRLRDIEIATHTDGLLDANEQAELQSLLAQIASLTTTEAAQLAALQDKAQTGPLKALLSILAEQIAVLEENLAQLYDDQFIETCAEWVVPYIGDLVGARGIIPFPGATFTRRAEVANTIAARRRKGTASMLEQLARDVTRWDAHVIEFFRVLATTQFMNHLRPQNRAFPDLKYETLALINTPFDEIPRTADVRNISTSAGQYNIPNVGIWLWRIQSYSVTNAAAYRVDLRRWKFDPLGRDIQLYNHRDNQTRIDTFSEPINVPAPITRLLWARRRGTYDPASISFRLTVNGNDEDFVICDLSDSGGGWAHTAQTKHAVDPELGRIALTADATDVRVTYYYGFSADMGGGEYTRDATADDQNMRVYAVPTDYPTIDAALQQLLLDWNQGGVFDRGVVELRTNDYFVTQLDLHIPKGKNVDIRAAQSRRPVVVLDSPARVTGAADSEFRLDGLWITGVPLDVPRFTSTGSANLLRVAGITHCTLTETLTIDADEVQLTIASSIVRSIRITDDAEAEISDSIVDAGAQTSAAYEGIVAGDAGAPLTVDDSTIFGTVYTRIMRMASNTIFAATSATRPPVHAEQVQKGCVRFSYVPPGSRVPRRYRCQPQRARIRPVFTSLRHGDAAYAQLARNCPVEIRTGADDQSEMGAFHDLMQPQREANLRARLDEFLRFGLEAGVFYAS